MRQVQCLYSNSTLTTNSVQAVSSGLLHPGFNSSKEGHNASESVDCVDCWQVQYTNKQKSRHLQSHVDLELLFYPLLICFLFLPPRNVLYVKGPAGRSWNPPASSKTGRHNDSPARGRLDSTEVLATCLGHSRRTVPWEDPATSDARPGSWLRSGQHPTGQADGHARR